MDGQQVDCGGAMVSKLTRVELPVGTFIDTVKVWQREWFYITEPHDADWAAAMEFRFGPPMTDIVDQEEPRLGVSRRSGTATKAHLRCEEGWRQANQCDPSDVQSAPTPLPVAGHQRPYHQAPLPRDHL